MLEKGKLKPMLVVMERALSPTQQKGQGLEPSWRKEGTVCLPCGNKQAPAFFSWSERILCPSQQGRTGYPNILVEREDLSIVGRDAPHTHTHTL